MGVTGLWQILSPAARPVTLDSLEEQVLAVDISIWLNQAISAMRDSSGHVLSNAHLLNLYQRLCKLLYYHIRPVFVFDGAAPALKQATLRARRQRKELAREEKQDVDHKLLQNFLQQHALNHVAKERSEVTGAPVAAPPKLPPRGFRSGGGARAQKDSAVFVLPRMEKGKLDPDGYQVAVERHWRERKEIVNSVLSSDMIKRNVLLKESIDFNSEEFKSLPLDVQHEILTEIKLRRKDKHSWHKIKQMPKDPGDFMSFQLKSVLFRGKVTHRLDKIESDMKCESAGDIVTTLTKRYHAGDGAVVDASRIASSDSSHFVLIKNSEKKSFMNRIEEENRKQENEDLMEKLRESTMTASDGEFEESSEEEDEDLERAIALSLQSNQHEIGSAHKKSSVKSEQFSEILQKLEPDDRETGPWNVADISDAKDNGTLSSKTDNENETKQASPISDVFMEESVKLVPDIEKNESKNGEDEVNQSDIKANNENEEEIKKNRESILQMLQKQKEDAKLSETSDVIDAVDENLGEVKTVLTHNEDNLDVSFVQRKDLSPRRSDTSDDDDDDFEDVEDLVDEGIEKEKDRDLVEVTEDDNKDNEVLIVDEGINESSSQSNQTKEIVREYLAQCEQEKGMRDLGSKLDEERTLLEGLRMRRDRADIVLPDQMSEDCQELLRLFGVPYVVAASEAEAQCAFLELVGLTQGTVTEDSDVWLFGGAVVYKHFFKKDKDVERYKIEDVKSHLCLDREKMICFAMLTGSDYTDGVQGVGGVSAFEFLHEFRVEGFEGLSRIKRWWENASKAPAGESFGSKVKNRLRGLNLSEAFPSQVVYEAYVNPDVDDSLEEFSWASPDLPGIREFARKKFGWAREKTDESLLPVVERMKERRPGTLDKWVRRWSNQAVAAKKAQGIPSLRVKTVLAKLNVLDEDEIGEEKGKGKGKGKSTKKVAERKKYENDDKKDENKMNKGDKNGEMDKNKEVEEKKGTVTTSENVATKEIKKTDSTDEKKKPIRTKPKSNENAKKKNNAKTKPTFEPKDPDSVNASQQSRAVTDKSSRSVPADAPAPVIQSRAVRNRRIKVPSRPAAAGGRGKRRVTCLEVPTPTEPVSLASPLTHPKLLRPEVDPTNAFSDEDDDEFLKMALIAEASQTDHRPKWEAPKVGAKRSYKSLINLSESESSDSD